MAKIPVVIVGGGMITQVQILPSIYQLQRLGAVGEIAVSALNGAPLKTLADDASFKKAFPGQTFTPYPDFTKGDLQKPYPELFKEVLSKLPARSAVVVALPDQLHYGAVKEALNAGHHVCCVKPLVLTYTQAAEIEELAFSKGLLVGIEYHKRFDDRSLIARRRYRAGLFGEFRLGQARLIEPWYYRHSNFQNWCTVENSDAFSYVACHYIDLVTFITGLKPVAVSVYGLVEPWPNGKKGFLWTDGRVLFDNGACLNVQNGFGYPDVGPGGNTQGLMMHFNGKTDGGFLEHYDSFRGVKHSLIEKGKDPGDTFYNETNPDYFQMVEAGGGALRPVGYGYRSIEFIVGQMNRINDEIAGLSSAEQLKKAQAILKQVDDDGIMATPKNSAYNELVMEAGRLSITCGGREAVIEYGKSPRVRYKEPHEYVGLVK
ncbi:MAG: Gfo/Idh/MocA family oxidoreductase [Fibrobacterota bacterium]